MGKLVYIMGKSGTGKSRSMKNIPAESFGLINPEGKDLPFGKDAPAFKVERVTVDSSSDITKQMQKFAKKYNIIVLDDFQTVMTNEFMRRSAEVGYQKWTDIGKHAWEIAEEAKNLPDKVIVYVLCHTEENDNGGEKIKTLGKLLDQNVVLESKSTIVLKTAVVDGKYYFLTQNNGKDTVKSPEGMFPAFAINNDLKYVDDKIRNYYDLPGAKSDAELAEADAIVAADIEKPDANGRRSRTGRSRAVAATIEQPKEAQKTRSEVQTENEQKMKEYHEACEQAVTDAAGDREEIPFGEACAAMDKVPQPDLQKPPRRTRKERQSEQAVCGADTYFYLEATDNYVMKHKGDAIPDGAKVISKEEFNEGVKRIAQAANPVEGAMNPPETPVRGQRRRRIR